MNAKEEIKKFIDTQNSLQTLKFITCGSVDDGKSTLLGRLLYEAQLIFDDQVDNLVKDSKKVGTQGGDIDFALLVDGLAAEREQGITIDVAYRFFTTEKRKFIVADSPGHEQYTRNMVTAASGAEVAIILIDARKGVLEQTKRHSFIADMVGIKNIIVAINKMDLIDYSEKKYKKIIKTFQNEIESNLDFEQIDYIPISALKGDNIISPSVNIPWYQDQSIMEMLESSEIHSAEENDFLMPVQYVNRPNLDFRGFSGQVSSGEIAIASEIIVPRTNETAKVTSIYLGDRPVKSCSKEDSVTLTLDAEIDISRGDIIATKANDLNKNNLFEANLIWLNEEKGLVNRDYLLKIGTKIIPAQIKKIKNKIDINTYNEVSGKSLIMNDIAKCEVMLDEVIDFTAYKKNKDLGSFILIDKFSNLTVGAGVINHSLRRSENIFWQETEIDQQAREQLLNQQARVIWLTGLSGSGKSTIANLLAQMLFSRGILSYNLDGDNMRFGLNSDLGFSDEDRIENIRRAGQVSKILFDAGIFVIASFISPFKEDREKVKGLFDDNKFFEIYVKADLETVKKRDVKGLYKKSDSGEIPNLTGIKSNYEEPQHADLIVDTTNCSPEESASSIIKYLEDHKWL